MKPEGVYVWSDIHVDVNKFTIEDILERIGDGDTERPLILAGDIATCRDLEVVRKLLTAIRSKYLYIVVVLGNHDYYGKSYLAAWSAWKRLREDIQFIGVYILMNEIFEASDGRSYAGSTLWSAQGRSEGEAMVLMGSMTDFVQIHGWHPYHANTYHRVCVEFLKCALERTHKKLIVVTHHMPSYSLIHRKYADSKTNAGHASDLDYMIDPKVVSLWVHGHTHMSHTRYINGVPVVCAPHGYTSEDGTATSPVFVELPIVEAVEAKIEGNL